MPKTAEAREPSMHGAPSYFRYGIADASARKVIGRANTGEVARADYSVPAWHLAIHLEDYLSDEATEDFSALGDLKGEALDAALWKFLKQEFPGCIALVPPGRRQQFLSGFHQAIEDGRLNF